MALKRHHPGCSTGVDCACADESECTLLFEPFSGDVPETLTVVAGEWDVNESGYLVTPDAAALIRTTTQHSSAGMRAETLLKGTQPGDLLRVVICWLDEDTYLAAELELNDCVLGDGVLRLIENGSTVATIAVADAVPDLFHRLRVCYDPAGGGSGSGSGGEDEGAPTLSALLTTAGHAVTGNQAQVQRRLSATVGEATGRYAALSTGETLADGAAFLDFAWYDDADDCPNCTPTAVCNLLADRFFRTPTEQPDPGCNWELLDGAAAPITEASAAPFSISVATLTGTMVSRVVPDSHVMQVQVELFGMEIDSAIRVELCRADADNFLFCRAEYSGLFAGSTLAFSLGEMVGGVENIIDTASVFSLFDNPSSFTLNLCYDGTLLIANPSVLGANMQGGVTETTARGVALTGEAGVTPVRRVFIVRRGDDGPRNEPVDTTVCGWCQVACADCYNIHFPAEPGYLPATVLLVIPFYCGIRITELVWTAASADNPACGEFVGELLLPAECGVTSADLRVVYRSGEVFAEVSTAVGVAYWRHFMGPPLTCGSHVLSAADGDAAVFDLINPSALFQVFPA